ncbi:Trm112 family protein [Melittangium boletus]|uniref:Trm112 family protein n=1 Tax=Melittangium boletus TaxID=83453 RepID=UPI003DA3E278
MPEAEAWWTTLACPVCEGRLGAQAPHPGQERGPETWLGCERCGRRYPVRDGVPRLRPEDASQPSGV